MRRSTVTFAITTLVFSLVALAGPAAPAAAADFDSSFTAESAFLNMNPGDTGQFAVGFVNTGAVGWVKAGATQVNLAVCASDKVTCSVASPNASWATGWLSTTAYATQATDFVGPGQIGWFSYNIKAPTDAVIGTTVTFNGDLVVANTLQRIHPEGYFQSVSVSGSLVRITGTLPASPSLNTQPTVLGNGAGNSCTVVIYADGVASGSGSSANDGSFAIMLNTPLASGLHTLTAKSTCGSTVYGNANAWSYQVGTGGGGVVGPGTATTTELGRIVRSFGAAMNCTPGSTAYIGQLANYNLTSSSPVPAIVGAVPDAGCTQVTLVLAAPGMALNGQYTLTISNVTDVNGNPLSGSNAVTQITAIDAANPTVSSAAYTSSQIITIVYSEAMTEGGGATGATNMANYNVDGISCVAVCAGIAQSVGLTDTRRDTLVALMLFAPATTGTHTLQIFNVADFAGKTFLSQPQQSLTFPPAGPYQLSSATGTTATTAVTVLWGGLMLCSGAANSANNVGSYTVTRSDAVNPAVIGTSACDNTINNGTQTQVVLTLSAALDNTKTYTLSATGVKDVFGATQSPSPSIVSITVSGADVTRPQVSTVTGTQNTLTITFSEPMKAANACGTNGPAAAVGAGNANIDNTGNFTSTDALLQDAITSAVGANGATLNATCSAVTFTFQRPVSSGTYHIQIGNGVAGTSPQDLAGNALTPNPFTSAAVSISDSTRPTILAVTGSGVTQNIVVTFSEQMSSTSVTTLANYQIQLTTAFQAMPAGTTVSCTGPALRPCSQITLVLPAATLTTGNAYILRISNVTDTAGNIQSPISRDMAFNAS